MQPDAEAAGTRRFTVPAGAFSPTADEADYSNQGHYLTAGGSGANFTVGLSFPADKVRIDRVLLRAYDNGGSQVCAWLWRAQSGTGTEVKMADVCSKGASPTTPRTFADNTIASALSGPWQGLYVWVYLPAGDYKFYGVTIEWTPL